MKSWLALLVVVALVVVGVSVLRGRSGGGQAPGPAKVEPSANLQDFLYTPYNTLNIAATDIHEYTQYEVASGLFGKKGLKYIVDPEVSGEIKVYGHGITWANALDEFCSNNGCRWELADPNTIRIRRAQAGQ